MTAPAPIRKTDPRTRPEATRASVRARVGDEIVVHGTTDGVVGRDGEIVGVRHHPDGTSPYDVYRPDDGRVPLLRGTRRVGQAAGTRTGGRRQP
ncbi:DUF1918 domain-containing protein [Streptomyces humi]|uniref:DUF1918 domain-containing protein n=1 Tax=Streptomyces humi TaxID=1428620 RepID=UPI0019D02D58|nr:DUF1918 domain-containing protein [Streptomyces humi]